MIGTFQNPETDSDYEAYEHTFKNVALKKNAPIRVEFSPHSNGKIPEADGHAFSRGRWTTLSISPSKKD